MESRKKVFENSFLYIFSSLLVKAINFLLLPLYTYFLTPEDYGITNMVTSFSNVAIYIVAFSLYSAIIRFYVDYKDDRDKLKRFFGTVLVFVFFSGIIFFIIIFISRYFVIKTFFKGISYIPFILIATLTLIFLTLHHVHQNILKGMQKGKKLVLINLIVFFTTVSFNLLFIIAFKLGALGILLSTLIVNILYFIFLLVDLHNNDLFKLCLDFKLLKGALKYSIPIIPHDTSTQIAQFASKVFINKEDSLGNVGIYGVSNHFGSVIDLIQASFNHAFQPWFFENMLEKSKKNRQNIISLSSFLIIIYSFVYIGIGLFSQEFIILLLPKSYALAWTVIPIFVVGFSIKSIYYFYVNILYYYKKAVKVLFIATISGSLLDIILAFYLVPRYGMYGAAIAFVCAKIIVSSIVVILSKRFDDIGYRVLSMLKIIMPSLIFMGLGLYFSYTKYLTAFSWRVLIYKILMCVIYIIFIYFTNKKHVINAVNIVKRLLKKQNS